jgi:hypothetical protein
VPTLRNRLIRLTLWATAYRRRLLVLAVVLLLVQMTAAYSTLTTTQEASFDAALEEFRERRASVAASPTPQQTEASQSKPSNAGPGRATGPAQSGGAASSNPAAAQQPACEWACTTEIRPPEEGVYTWYTCGKEEGQCTGNDSEPRGSEEFGGLPRDLPRRGQRYVAITGTNTWNNVHIYAEEHREEFDLAVTAEGVFNSRYEVDIKVGPVGGGSDMRQQPPIQFVKFPLTDGLSWKGSWKDANEGTDGSYSCRVVGREVLTIGGVKVRTWVIEASLKLQGPDNVGDVNVRFWVSPENRQTVQEFYDQRIQTPQGPYRGKWMVTLANLEPRR